jgi:hypothetical protein
MLDPTLNAKKRRPLMGSQLLRIATAEIAFAEVMGDLIKRTLFPLFGLCQPEHSTLGIQRGTLSAHIFLTA